MNYELLADEVRSLAGGDVDAEIQFSGMTDREIVEHVVTCPCCEERGVSDEQLDYLVTNATSLEDFINSYNETQRSYQLTPPELEMVSEVINSAIQTAVNLVCINRGIDPRSDTSLEIHDQVIQFTADGDWMEFI